MNASPKLPTMNIFRLTHLLLSGRKEMDALHEKNMRSLATAQRKAVVAHKQIVVENHITLTLARAMGAHK